MSLNETTDILTFFGVVLKYISVYFKIFSIYLIALHPKHNLNSVIMKKNQNRLIIEIKIIYNSY